eukprot:1160899-Pelagomonas_calceolata.AAC.5
MHLFLGWLACGQGIGKVEECVCCRAHCQSSLVEGTFQPPRGIGLWYKACLQVGPACKQEYANVNCSMPDHLNGNQVWNMHVWVEAAPRGRMQEWVVAAAER